MSYISKDELLSKLGLETKPSAGQMIVSAIGPFGVGMLLGAGVALLFAPKSGRKLREDIRTRINTDAFVGHDSKMTNGGMESNRRPV
jgi:hypothetical protein